MGIMRKIGKALKRKRGSSGAKKKPARRRRGPLGLGSRRKKPSRAAGVSRKKVTGGSRKWKKPSKALKRRPGSVGASRFKKAKKRGGGLRKLSRKLKKVGSKLKRAFSGRRRKKPSRPKLMGGRGRRMKTKRHGKLK